MNVNIRCKFIGHDLFYEIVYSFKAFKFRVLLGAKTVVIIAFYFIQNKLYKLSYVIKIHFK